MKPQPIQNGFGPPDPVHDIPCYCDYYPPSAMLWPDEKGGILNGDAGHPWLGVERLWVKECHRFPSKENPRVRVDYRADMSSWGIADSHNVSTNEVIANAKLFGGRANEYSKQHWRPSIFMPRWASRITLKIEDVEAERLNKINEADAIAEGIEVTELSFKPWYRDYRFKDKVEWFSDPRDSYHSLWESINGLGSWTLNPWVWKITFRVCSETPYTSSPA